MKNIHKIYPNGTKANQGIDLSINEGEIHALVGENGAGKSTLMKVLFGLEAPTMGEIHLNGNPVWFNGPRDAIKNGIGMVHQHFMLVPSFTVAENIVLGDEPKKGFFRDNDKAVEITKGLIKEYGLDVDPFAKVDHISVGKKQRVEILKVLYRGAKLLILDEPTAVLTPQETTELFKSLKDLVKSGYTIIFITHKLKEVMDVSDRITVLRAGKTVGHLITKDTNEEEISRMMVGRDVLLRVAKKPAEPKETILKVSGLTVTNAMDKDLIHDMSFEIRAGEIFGIAGVEGNGQTELVEALTGLRPVSSGEISYLGKPLNGLSVKAIRDSRIAHIPEDRQTRGACLNASIEENLILDRYRDGSLLNGPLLSDKKIKAYSDKMVAEYDIRTASAKNPGNSLSGGNLQKVVIAREFSKDPKLLIASQPTRGVDIGAIEFIHREIIKKRDEGSAVLVISAELSEVMSLADRIGVMYNGELAAVLENNDSLTEEEIGYYMLGVKKQAKEVAGIEK